MSALRRAGAIASSVILSGCALLAGGTRDYVLRATGTVIDAAQRPVEDAKVTLEAGSPPEQAKGPNHKQVYFTTSSGHFEFTYISYDRRLPYRLTVDATGCRQSTIDGISGEKRQHRITLEACEGR